MVVRPHDAVRAARLVVAIWMYGGLRLNIFASIEILALLPALLGVGALLVFRPRPWVVLAAASDLIPATTLALRAHFFAFTPTTLPVNASAVTRIVFTNDDVALRTFTYAVAARTYSHEVRGGTSESIDILLPTVGSVRYGCELHSSGDHTSGMTGVFDVASRDSLAALDAADAARTELKPPRATRRARCPNSRRSNRTPSSSERTATSR
ncbi:MAG: cupredoxin domain-containing protein [Thermoplasmatota archaeon]